jgi:hypothetical protein
MPICLREFLFLRRGIRLEALLGAYVGPMVDRKYTGMNYTHET